MAFKFDQKLKKRKNALKKLKNLTHHTDFALISTHFVCWGCNFTWSRTMYMPFCHILWTNLWTCLEIKVNQDNNPGKKRKFTFFGFCSIKYDKILCALWNFMWNYSSNGQMCGNESKIRMRSQIYGLISMQFSYFSIFDQI